MAARTYKSKAMAALHENMADLHQVGLIDDKTMRSFDAACLTPVEQLSASSIKHIRTRASVSQAVFAAHLNITTRL